MKEEEDVRPTEIVAAGGQAAQGHRLEGSQETIEIQDDRLI